METVHAEDLILIEEKEPITSKEIFKEYSKKKKIKDYKNIQKTMTIIWMT